jgi:pyridoxamine 5'-phosphate oxidase
MAFSDLRREYMQRGLQEDELAEDPFRQFQQWFDAALAADLPEPNAMTLATATRDGSPSARMVLLKQVDDRGFVFFSNYESRKGNELAENPRAALIFFWVQLERQIRIEGAVERVSAAESDAYFHSRPSGSQISAAASHQSQIIAGREVLEKRVAELETEYPDGEVPRPAYWGGFRVIPETVEFWQGRANRLHDRLRYRKDQDGHWLVERLSP